MIPTLFIVTILVFLSVRFIPGDIIDIMMGDLAYMGIGSIDREALERRLGLDVPGYVQYGRWVGGILLHGTLGDSLLGGLTIEEQILARLPVTLELGVLALVIGFLIALPVGIYSAISPLLLFPTCENLFLGFLYFLLFLFIQCIPLKIIKNI